MRKTTTNDIPLRDRLTVDTVGLMGLTSLGKESAVKIGMNAGAKLSIGKRVLWKVDKVIEYLDQMAAEQ